MRIAILDSPNQLPISDDQLLARGRVWTIHLISNIADEHSLLLTKYDSNRE